MKHNFRSQAHEALKRARAELDAERDERLRYAALELRLCIEAITYDRAQAFIEELPREEYKTWQPNKLMEVLIEIEPMAGSSGRVRFRRETAPGEPEAPWQDLGEDRVFGLRDIKRSYSKLGNFLHYPTLDKLQTGGTKPETMKRGCLEIANSLEHVLSAPLHNFNLKNLITFECIECGSKVRKRFLPGDRKVAAKCFNCRAEYALQNEADGQPYKVTRKTTLIECMTAQCAHSFDAPVEEVRPGVKWNCPVCKNTYGFVLGVALLEE